MMSRIIFSLPRIFLRLGDEFGQLLVFLLYLFSLQAGELLQLHFQDGLGLDLGQMETL